MRLIIFFHPKVSLTIAVHGTKGPVAPMRYVGSLCPHHHQGLSDLLLNISSAIITAMVHIFVSHLVVILTGLPFSSLAPFLLQVLARLIL